MLAAALFLGSACHMSYLTSKPVYSESKYLEPLPAGLVIGRSPRIVPGPLPPGVKKTLSPLPPLLIRSGRPIYFYNNRYYYFWQGGWYFSRKRTGPWRSLPVEFYPKETKVIPPTPYAPVKRTGRRLVP